MIFLSNIQKFLLPLVRKPLGQSVRWKGSRNVRWTKRFNPASSSSPLPSSNHSHQHSPSQQQQQQQTGNEIPTFNQLLRIFYKRSHPDLLKHSHPEYSLHNTQSLQILNDLLETIQKPNGYPAFMRKELLFYVRDHQNPSKVTAFPLKLQTSGGECKKALTTSFQEFFLAIDLFPKAKKEEIGRGNKNHHHQKGLVLFQWNKEYFYVPCEAEYDELVKQELLQREKEEQEEKRRKFYEGF